MLRINDGIAVNIIWKDDDESKDIGGMEWFNGETKILNADDSEGIHWHHAESMPFGMNYGQYNATRITETKGGIVIRSQSNPGYLQTGEIKDADYNMPEYDLGVGKAFHDEKYMELDGPQGYLKPSLESRKMFGMYT